MIVLIRKDDPAMDLDSPTDQPFECRLLALPAELRINIWQLVLVQDARKNAYKQPGRSRFCANVLRTCKQINLEGTPILYGENIFSAHTNLLATLPAFLLQVQPSRVPLRPVVCPRVAKLIRRFHVFVRLDTDPRYSKRQVEESFNGVEELQIDVFQAMYASSDFSVLRLFEGVRGVGKVTIMGSLGDGKYADWLARCMEMPIGASITPYYEKYVGGVPCWDAWTHGNR